MVAISSVKYNGAVSSRNAANSNPSFKALVKITPKAQSIIDSSSTFKEGIGILTRRLASIGRDTDIVKISETTGAQGAAKTYAGTGTHNVVISNVNRQGYDTSQPFFLNAAEKSENIADHIMQTLKVIAGHLF